MNIKPKGLASTRNVTASPVQVRVRKLIVGSFRSLDDALAVDLRRTNIPVGAEIVRASDGESLATLESFGAKCGWLLRMARVA